MTTWKGSSRQPPKAWALENDSLLVAYLRPKHGESTGVSCPPANPPSHMNTTLKVFIAFAQFLPKPLCRYACAAQLTRIKLQIGTETCQYVCKNASYMCCPQHMDMAFCSFQSKPSRIVVTDVQKNTPDRT